MKSLSRNFLIGVGAMSLAVTVLGSIAAFVAFEQELSKRQISFMGDYVRERSQNVEKRFSNLNALQAAAAMELQRRVDKLPPRDVDRLLDVYYPLQRDGTRRSRAPVFDGQMQPDGVLVYGMGAFLSQGDRIPALEKAVMVAAFPIVSSFGQASHSAYDNFYFFTPSARLVMFGPDRRDHLMFYRHDAPANLSISDQQMAKITLPAQDPSHATRCTNLQHLIQNAHAERLATGCLTPAYVDGRYVGSFGSSIELTGFFLDAVRNALPGASNLVVTSDGQLIAYPGFARPGIASSRTVAGYERSLGLKKLMWEIARDGRRDGVINSSDGRQIVAFGRLSGPDWYLLLTCPTMTVIRSAVLSASWILLIGLLASAAQTLMIVLLARRSIVKPLQQLAASCDPEARAWGDERAAEGIKMLERRPDEIGVLAAALRTEREKVDEVLDSLEVRVSERTAELERANAEKSRFLANMSHELRTPLNGVIAISQTLAGVQDTPRNRELADLIVSSGRLLEQVLTDILDFSKIEAGEIALADETFSLEAVVRRICELHRAAAEAKGLVFDWRVAPEAAGFYRGDSVRLTQILSNLLSNAVKFTEAGSVSLSVREDQNTLLFTVRDTGIGFDDVVKARLFRRFEQADDSIRRRFGGTGLGLAISRSLVELMGGLVSVQSRPGEGSVFEVALWLPRMADVEIEQEDDDEDFSFEGRRVLLAEDHPTNQKVIQLILDSVGVDLQIVDNGALALERLRREPFDLVLMDMQMPELDGLAATEAFRRFERGAGHARTPVIMLTANAMDEHVRASLAAGADRHLSKPIRAEDLLHAMAQLILERAAHSTEAAQLAG
jgi:signal transduction histidine kinase/AmiR/NasT family two-component response regulator